MISYLLVILFLLFSCWLSYIVFKKDILSPAFITSAVFMMGVVFSCIGISYWNDKTKLSFETISVLIFGVLFFVIGSVIASQLKKKLVIKKNQQKMNYNFKEFSFFTLIVICVCFLFVLIMALHKIKFMCSALGFNSRNFSELLSFYRHNLLNNNFSSKGIEIGFFIKQSLKFISVLNGFLFYNLIVTFSRKKREKKYYILNLTAIILCFIISFFTNGGRTILLHYIVADMIIFIIYKRNNDLKSQKVNKLKVMKALVILFIIFYFGQYLVGRSVDVSPISYISFYFGCPISSLEHYFTDNMKISGLFGGQTFAGIYFILNKLKFVDSSLLYSDQWVYYGSGLGSNVYSSLKCYYNDFGIIGIILLQFIFGFLWSKFYENCKESKDNFGLFLYSYYFYILIEQLRAEQFYSLINTSTIIIIIMTYFVYKLMFKKGEKNEKIIGKV